MGSSASAALSDRERCCQYTMIFGNRKIVRIVQGSGIQGQCARSLSAAEAPFPAIQKLKKLNLNVMTGYMYILKCSNDCYYTGSTLDLERRLAQHQAGEGSNYTKKHLPVELVYFEEYARIDEAFYREKQVQGWSRAKKEALIVGQVDRLHGLAACKNGSHFLKDGDE